jgi:hypothetical protein
MANTQENESVLDFQELMPDFTNIAMTIPKMQATAARAFFRQQKEILSFLDNRCNADIDLIGNISNASDMKEIFEAYSGFLLNAAKDYAEEAKNEADVSSATLVDITSGLRSVTDIVDGKEMANKLG